MTTNPLGSALEGVRVVDFSTNVAGPYAGMILADLGAQVTKVERPGTGDPSRAMTPTVGATSAVYHALNRGKRSVELDLKEDAGVEQAFEFLREADILLESFRPGVMDRLGLGFEAVHQTHPTLTYCSISGFGYEAETKDLGAYDPLIQAFSGHLEMTGDPEGEPSRSGASIVDVSAGMWAAMGILGVRQLPLLERGIHLQVSLLDSIMAVMAHQVAAVSLTGRDIPRLGSASPLLAPYEAFETADKPVMIAVGNEELYRRFADVLDLPGLLTRPELSTNAKRIDNRDTMKMHIENALKRDTAQNWIEAFARAGVPCSPVNTLRQALAEPLVAERGVLSWESRPDMPLVASPMRVNGQPIDTRSPASDKRVDV